MADREREVRAATAPVAHLIRVNPDADIDILAHEIVMLLYTLGWRHAVKPAPDWAHRGSGLPTEGSEAARRLAEYRAQAGTGRRP